MPSPRIEITFAGQDVVLDGAGTLYWPAQHTLIVSDMHLEKSTYLAQHGAFIAPYDTIDTLERLEGLIALYRPRELILLGDSFHDRFAWERLGDALRERILNLSAMVERCSWIEGNHDVGLLGQTLNHTSTDRIVSGIRFTHDYAADSPLPQIIGHYHPKTTLTLANQTLRQPCFVVTPHLLIMPSFGKYTGGLDIRHEAFTPLLAGHPFALYLLYRSSVYPVT